MSDYNGWKNWETWNLNVWITNEEGSYAAARDAAQQGQGALELWCEDYAWSMMGYDALDQAPACVATDFINASLREVDYRELRESLLEATESP